MSGGKELGFTAVFGAAGVLFMVGLGAAIEHGGAWPLFLAGFAYCVYEAVRAHRKWRTALRDELMERLETLAAQKRAQKRYAHAMAVARKEYAEAARRAEAKS